MTFTSMTEVLQALVSANNPPLTNEVSRELLYSCKTCIVLRNNTEALVLTVNLIDSMVTTCSHVAYLE